MFYTRERVWVQLEDDPKLEQSGWHGGVTGDTMTSTHAHVNSNERKEKETKAPQQY